MLDSLAWWRIAPDRVKFSSTGDCKAGLSADVQLASLYPKEPLPPGGPDDAEHVAVKKFRFTEESSADRALAVSDPFAICLLPQCARRAPSSQPFAHEVSLLAGLSHLNIAQLRGFSKDFERGTVIDTRVQDRFDPPHHTRPLHPSTKIIKSECNLYIHKSLSQEPSELNNIWVRYGQMIAGLSGCAQNSTHPNARIDFPPSTHLPLRFHDPFRHLHRSHGLLCQSSSSSEALQSIRGSGIAILAGAFEVDANPAPCK